MRSIECLFKGFTRYSGWLILLDLGEAGVYAPYTQDASGPILFTNVNVFDGVNEAQIENANVVVTDNLITAVSAQPLAILGGTVIDVGGNAFAVKKTIDAGKFPGPRMLLASGPISQTRSHMDVYPYNDVPSQSIGLVALSGAQW